MQDTPAAKAGIQAGDRIVSIDGIENPTWEQVIPREALNPNQPLDVTIDRGGQLLTKTIVPEADRTKSDGFGRLGTQRSELPDYRSRTWHAGGKGWHEAGR